MTSTFEKLFKGYTIKEIEEIVIKAGFKASDKTKKQALPLFKPLSRYVKRPRIS